LEGDLLTGFAARDFGPQFVERLDPLAVDSGDDVVHLDAGLVRGRARVDLGHLALLGLLVGLQPQARDQGRAAVPHLPLSQVFPGVVVGVHGDVYVAGDGRLDPAVDADDAALHVEQGAARVAADQGAVGADEDVAEGQHPAQADGGRAALLEAARVADRDAPLAFFQPGRLAQLAEGVLPLFGDLDHAAVHAAVPAQGLALDLLAVGEGDDPVAFGLAGDVSGGEDVAVFRDDDAATLARPDLDVDHGGHDLVQDLADLGLDLFEVLDGFGDRFVEGRGELPVGGG